MKEETERLDKLVDWYKFKLDEIREAPVDSGPRKLEKLCQSSEKNKHLGVRIIPFVGNYPSISIIRNAVNPATPVII